MSSPPGGRCARRVSVPLAVGRRAWAVGAAEPATFPDAREELRSEAGAWEWSA